MKENKNILKNEIEAETKSVGVQLRVIKKPAGVLPNIILENRGIRKHRDWSNLLHRVCTYISNHWEDSASSYQNRFGLLLRLLNQQNYRRLLNHHLLLNVFRQNKLSISLYKILNKLENNINHIKTLEATFRFEGTPKGYSFFGFYIKQVFHNFSVVYYKYNKYNKQCQVVNKLALSV